MTLPASGNIGLIEIAEEVFGVGTTGKSLVECGDAADPSVGSAPYSMSDFYSHTQNWGRVYSDLTISYTAYIKRLTEGSYYQVVSGPSLRFTGNRDEQVAVYQDNDGSDTPISSGDGVTLELYYRAKQSSDSWVLLSSHPTYTSGALSLTLSQYDYQIKLIPD